MSTAQSAVKFEMLPNFKPLHRASNWREFAIHSGRGAGKSHAVAEFLIISSLKNKHRILCVREVQNSIKDSVLKLLADKISHYKLDYLFDIQRTCITCKLTGSEFIFAGLARNTQSIKSMEGITICWIEEAQTITQESLDILLPTIFRNKGAQVVYTYNPRMSTDAVYQRFHSENIPPNVIVKRVDWRDNPYFSDAMKEEMDFAKKHDPEMAAHVWEGALCPSPNDIAVIPLRWLRLCVDAHVKMGLDVTYPFKYIGLDFADGGSDKSAIALRQGALVIDALELPQKKFINQTVEQAHGYAQVNGKIESLHFDAIGIGAGAKGDFNRLKPNYFVDAFSSSSSPKGKDRKFTNDLTNGQFFRNLKAQAWWHIRLRVENTLRLIDAFDDEAKAFKTKPPVNPHACFFVNGGIQQLDKLLMELSQASYKHEDGKLMVDKAPNNQASPNIADAVILSFARELDKGGLKSF